MMRRVLALITAVLTGSALVAAPAVAGSSAAPDARSAGVRHVHVHGASVTLDCIGSGRPTVVLFAGFGDKHSVWDHIQQRLAAHNRVCSYDRLGEGSSSKPHRTQTLRSNARLLHAVLHKAHIGGRLVLVGHSIGGDVATAYARRYQHASAGLVTFDATPPGYLNFTKHLIPSNATGVLQELRQEAVAITSGKNAERLKVAGGGWAPPKSLHRMPVAVVEHGKNIFAGLGKYTAPLQHGWAQGQRRLSRVSSRSQLIIATHSGHYIYVDQPRLALDVINAVIAES